MTARCKFTVESVQDFGNNNRKMRLVTKYDEALSKEDQAFSKYTPSGNMEVTITNPNVFDIFKPGAVVYVDITPCATST